MAVRGPTRQPRAGVRDAVHADIGRKASNAGFQLLVEQCPAEHTGLGVGTQLGLAVAKALAVAMGHGDWSSVELARAIGRGERSAIGVHGFDRGGLLVEAGKCEGEAVAPLIAQVALPPARGVSCSFDPPAPAWHGDRERAAFAEAGSGEPERSDMLAETAILPAARAGDLDRVRRGRSRVQPAGGRAVRGGAGRSVCLAGHRGVDRGVAQHRHSRRGAEFVGADRLRDRAGQ